MVADLGNRLVNLESKEVNVTVEENESMFTNLEYLPVNNLEGMQNLENYLCDAQLMQKAVKELSQIGGTNVYNFIFRSMEKLITNKFCGAVYSFQGRRKKESFQKLKLDDLLIKACMTIFKDTTLNEIEQNISKWIRRCAERGKDKNV
ncbi:uncharacterized protein LOC116166077 [Photinus pyralis]|nr:uncharacterized protein LOC116166077 [Photinus pyralis]